MAKFSKKKLDITGMAGSLVGGAAGGMLGGVIPVSNVYLKNGIIAVGGAALSAFVGGDLMKGIGNGLISVAGAQLAANLFSSTPAAASGLGSAWQTGANAVGFMPSQRSIGQIGAGAGEWINQRMNASASAPVPKVNNVN